MDPVITPQALTDLEDISFHIAQDNPEAADRFIAELLAVTDALGRHPHMGRLRPELRKGVRSFPHGDYLLLYEIVAQRVRVLHVAHGSRRLNQLFR